MEISIKAGKERVIGDYHAVATFFEHGKEMHIIKRLRSEAATSDADAAQILSCMLNSGLSSCGVDEGITSERIITAMNLTH